MVGGVVSLNFAFFLFVCVKFMYMNAIEFGKWHRLTLSDMATLD